MKHNEKRQRGRPVGTAPTAAEDEVILRRAAIQLFRLLQPNITKALRSLIDMNDPRADTRLRRLQLRWANDGDKYFELLQRELWQQRWEFDQTALASELPELHDTVVAFANSPAGRAHLKYLGNDDEPLHPMSLGVVALVELIDLSNAKDGPRKAEFDFPVWLGDCSEHGLDDDAEFLRRFGELCLQRAEKLASKGPLG